jgi:uncharacterized protein (TIGR00251 family)
VVELPAFYRWQDGNLILFCHIQPGASADEFAGQHGDRLKIRLRLAAVDGKANAGLIAFIAKEFSLNKQAVTLTAGTQSRQKTLKISAPRKIPAALTMVIAAR